MSDRRCFEAFSNFRLSRPVINATSTESGVNASRISPARMLITLMAQMVTIKK